MESGRDWAGGFFCLYLMVEIFVKSIGDLICSNFST